MKPIKSHIYLLEVLLVFSGLLITIQPASAQPEEDSVRPEADLISYVMAGDAKGLSSALANGGDINQTTKVGNTPLMVAAKIGDRQILDVLLNHQADVNLRNNAGATALMIAAKYDHLHVVTNLLESGADPTIKNNNGHTAAVFAMGYKNYKIYDYIVKAEEHFLARM